MVCDIYIRKCDDLESSVGGSERLGEEEKSESEVEMTMVPKRKGFLLFSAV